MALPVVTPLRLFNAVTALFAPVPPFAMFKTPDIVMLPDAVTGPPVNVTPVVPPLTSIDVTVPDPPPPPPDDLAVFNISYIPSPGVMYTLAVPLTVMAVKY